MALEEVKKLVDNFIKQRKHNYKQDLNPNNKLGYGYQNIKIQDRYYLYDIYKNFYSMLFKDDILNFDLGIVYMNIAQIVKTLYEYKNHLSKLLQCVTNLNSKYNPANDKDYPTFVLSSNINETIIIIDEILINKEVFEYTDDFAKKMKRDEEYLQLRRDNIWRKEKRKKTVEIIWFVFFYISAILLFVFVFNKFEDQNFIISHLFHKILITLIPILIAIINTFFDKNKIINNYKILFLAKYRDKFKCELLDELRNVSS